MTALDRLNAPAGEGLRSRVARSAVEPSMTVSWMSNGPDVSFITAGRGSAGRQRSLHGKSSAGMSQGTLALRFTDDG
jgi:hypothetical protein